MLVLFVIGAITVVIVMALIARTTFIELEVPTDWNGMDMALKVTWQRDTIK